MILFQQSHYYDDGAIYSKKYKAHNKTVSSLMRTIAQMSDY